MARSARSPFIVPGEELLLSNHAQLELLRAHVERGVSLRMSMLGYSMEPLIRSGDVLTVAPMPDREPRLGEVIAFVGTHGARLYVHRVVERAASGWLMRGDNSSHADGVFSREAMVGRVVRVERRGRLVDAGLNGTASVFPRRGAMQRALVSMQVASRRLAAYVVRHTPGRRP